MSEADMVAALNQTLTTLGIADTVEVAGQFQPRGTSGAFLAGGLVGGTAGDALGPVGDALGTSTGAWTGAAAAAEARNLPMYLLVGVSTTMVYGFPGRSRHRPPDDLTFAVARAGLRAVVHQRGAVRVLELIHDDTGSQIELEGSRLPVTHSKDVIDELVGG
jgi:hypothetical protein